MKLTLPLPAQSLSPNARVHWAAKAKATKAARSDACFMATLWLKDHPDNTCPWETATVALSFWFARRGRRDPDNMIAWVKAYIDGLRDARVLADDDKLIYLPPINDKDVRDPRLEIEVLPIK